ncbi:MAG TPA: lytic transglycosylase domain-containing protein [Anaerolineales bacterium]|nr:lytic transglycosylase domain-containing protein [Anaerolineales bacterium]
MDYEYDEFEEEYEEYDYEDEEYEYDAPNDYYHWVDEWEVSTPMGGGFSSLAVTGVMPVLAIGVSLVMFLLFIRFAVTEMPELDEIPAPELQTEASAVVLPPAGAVAAFFTPSVQYWQDEIVRWAGEWAIDPNLVATVMQIESCGNPQAVSSVGASGLFQVMPFHFQAGENPFDPNTNAYRGMSYLSRALESFGGDVKMALAGYNAGIGGASRGEALWPAETVRYTTWGVGIYEDARTGKSESATLNEWLSRASGMCNAAQTQLGLTP